MPTYDYECDACGHSFELFQTITEPVQKKCPECKKSKLRRLFGTGAAIMFKGSGFYQTDYRSESYRKAAQADKSASSDGGSSTAESASNGSDSKGSSKTPKSTSSTDSSSSGGAAKKDGGSRSRKESK